MPDPRPYDLVLVGATGFTGGLTAEYLARHAPAGCRWALAGRNRPKLEDVRSRLAEIDGSLAALPLLHGDVQDAASVREVAECARVVITTVGPYIEYGEPLVAACAEAGTDYVDITGEPEFVDRMYVAHHETAQASGARIVHACGFDSVPHDLGAWFTVQQLPEGEPLRVRGMLRAGGAFSGGTFHTAVAAMSRRRQAKQAAAARRRVEPRPDGRRVRASARRPHRDTDTGYWLVPLPTIDPHVVKRSAMASERYGPDFEYAHYAAARRLPTVVGAIAGVGALMTSAQVPLLRTLVLDRVPQGSGPSAEKRASAWFCVEFVGSSPSRPGLEVRTRVAGGDPGCDETAKMLAESALCLAFDRNPSTAGMVTTATAMAENLKTRLEAAGIEFAVQQAS